MRKSLGVLAVLLLCSLAVAPTASAVEPGKKPSAAPTISTGQHYFSQLSNNRADGNWNNNFEVHLWRLPSLFSHDVVTVDWHVAPDPEGDFEVCMVLAENVDDFSWGTRFDEVGANYFCDEDGPVYHVSGSGTARTPITAQNSSSGSTYLEFFSETYREEAPFRTYPYDFTVESIQHYIAVTMARPTEIGPVATLTASANLGTGAPVPDGMAFLFTATWETPSNKAVHHRSYTATTGGGQMAFQVGLPTSAEGKNVSIAVTRPADSQYLAADSGAIMVPVVHVSPPPRRASPCSLARRRAHVLARQQKRLARHARGAHGPQRASLLRRMRKVGRKLQAARRQAGRSC